MEDENIVIKKGVKWPPSFFVCYLIKDGLVIGTCFFLYFS
jgi:hypothetical protein